MTKIVNCYSANLSAAKKTRQLSLKSLNLGLFVFILAFGFLYLLNISDLTVKGFALRELKIQATDLASAKLENEEKINDLQSYYSLNSRTQKLNMVAVGNVEYLAATNPVVAKK
ncbi:MAG: hypothetical protein WC523_05875 [Patescibacteria group bacterium]|jgi:hypothetical protein